MIQVKFNDKAKQVLADTLDLSGSVVVTELPTVGEPHTIYELQETKAADFSWLLTEIDNANGYPTSVEYLVVVENEEDVTYENLKIRSIDANQTIGVYVKSTNKVYQCWWEEAEIGEEGAPDYTFTKEEIIPKQDILYGIGKTIFVILKDFDYHSTGGEESDTLDGTGHLLDGTEFDYEDYLGIVPLVLTDATNKQFLLDDNLIGYEEFTSETQLKHPVQVNKIDLSIITDIIDEGGEPVFAPQPSKQVSTYWIYTNNEWVNIDNIESPTDYVAMVFSSRGYFTAPIPLNKIHIYLDDSTTQLTIVPVDFPEETVVYGGYIYIQKDKDITTNHTFKLILDNDVTFGDLGARVSLEGFWGGTSFSPVIQETFTAITTGGLGTLILINESDNPK